MKLPLLISVPHAGLVVPPEARSICALGRDALVADSDGGAREIYALADETVRFETTEVARALVDLNRAPDDFRSDGVIKTHTSYEVPVWAEPPSRDLVARLLDRYYAPYHARLSRPDAAVVVGVDCHTMAAIGPPVAPDPGVRRPQVCLGNADGTLPDAWFRSLVECFRVAFDGEVTVNRPFRGGYITRHHAAERPWVQIELSRAEFDSLEGKRARVLRALRAWTPSLLC